jgi:hypothetical protein
MKVEEFWATAQMSDPSSKMTTDIRNLKEIFPGAEREKRESGVSALGSG